MPVYSGVQYAIYPGDAPFVAINNEASTVYPSGTPAQACAIGEPWNKGPINISVELLFSADPGAFEVDIQTADTDSTNAYQGQTGTGWALTSASTGSGSGTIFSARTELAVKAHFVRPYVKTQTANGVNITCNISG